MGDLLSWFLSETLLVSALCQKGVSLFHKTLIHSNSFHFPVWVCGSLKYLRKMEQSLFSGKRGLFHF
jgi:hypothetical protein